MWVGKSNAETQALFNLIKNPQQWEKLQELSLLEKYLDELCQRKYWTRLWIIQEVILASNIAIQCGADSCQWFQLRWCLNKLGMRCDEVTAASFPETYPLHIYPSPAHATAKSILSFLVDITEFAVQYVSILSCTKSIRKAERRPQATATPITERILAVYGSTMPRQTNKILHQIVVERQLPSTTHSRQRETSPVS